MMTRLGSVALLSLLVACTGSKSSDPPATPACTDVTIYMDADGDGVGAGDAMTACLDDPDPLPPSTAATTGDCNDGDAAITELLVGYADRDGDHVTVATSTELCVASLPPDMLPAPTGADCDDTDPLVAAIHTFYVDDDGDGYGNPASTIMVCANTPPSGHALDGSDPDDSNAAITPIDVDGDLVSDANDCAPNDATAWTMATIYADGDNDGFDGGSSSACVGQTPPAGNSFSSLGSDCDDTDPAVALLRMAYPDSDGDTWGTGAGSLMCVVTLPAGYAGRNGDCNDGDPALTLNVHGYADADGDHYGVGASEPFCVANAAALPAGYAGQVGDCNDQDPTAHALVYGYVDGDGDGYGAGAITGICAASLPAGYASNNYDFNDANATIGIRQVTASIYQPAASPNCSGNYCAGVVYLLLSQGVATDVTVSSYSRALWCIYGKTGTVITSATVMGYEKNTIYPNYVCGLPVLQFGCPSSYTYQGVTYSRKNVPYIGSCTPETSTPGTYLSTYDVYSSSLIVK